MPLNDQALIDGDRILEQDVLDVVGRRIRKTVTFTATGDGAVGAHNLFLVTGHVELKIRARCTVVTTIQAGATIEVGPVGNTAAIIAQTAADAPDDGEIWHDATPDADNELASVHVAHSILDANVILTVATDTVDSGAVVFECEWRPISDGATVVVG